MTDDPQLQARLDTLLAPDPAPALVTETSVQAQFSPFIPAHSSRAGEVASRLFEVADADGLEAAVTAAEEAALAESSSGLVKRAIKTFVTHHPEARSRLTLPTVDVVDTRELAASEAPPAPAIPEEPLPPGEVDQAARPSRTLPEAERRLDWYREDPFANYHHAHWHDVWNGDGIERAAGRLITQGRQGELFFYMHQQMLARYDTERTIAGLAPTVPFDAPYTAPIAEGYGAPGYATRPAGVTLRPMAPPQPPVGPADLAARYDKIDAAIDAAHFDVPGRDLGPLTDNQLGAAIEPSHLRIDSSTDIDLADGGYANLHGLGHVLTALSVDQGPGDTYPGVMAFTETAIRDPFFYRWHRHIDDQSARLQDGLAPADLDEHAAAVSFRGDGAADVALVFSDQIDGGDFDGFARERLGTDFDDPDAVATDTLTTRFALTRVTAPIPQQRQGDPDEESYWTTHLTHRPFALCVRVEAAAPQRATVRVFLVHEALAENRRMWVELDKFDRELVTGVNVLGRPDALSSVIKRKGVSAPGAVEPGNGDAWCDCGWPYTLLLPSGASSPEGTRFKLAVILTDWATDHAGDPRSCGSMSFCGARGAYPDEREMGYPFHRPFPDGVLATLAGRPNVALRDVAIRCETPRPPE